MPLHLSRALSIAAVTTLVSVCARAADPLTLSLQPVFQGNLGTGGMYGLSSFCGPIAVELRNDGPDARGVLAVTDSDSTVEYPVELPRGADKRLITYPRFNYGEVHFSLQTDQGHVERDEALAMTGEQSTPVLLISDTFGELSFIVSTDKKKNDGSPQANATTYNDCYGKPGEGPTRPVGYSPFGAVILGAGAERLSDEEVQALKLWVDTGGTLVFLGGASSPILSDKRWAELLPAQDFHISQIAESSTLTSLGGSQPPAMTVMSGTPVKGASSREEGSVLLWADKPFGLGLVKYLSFNPFDSPLDHWDGRREALTKILRTSNGIQSGTFLQGYAGNDNQGNVTVSYGATYPGGRPAGPAYGSTPGPASGSSSSVTSIEDDPFSMTLPPTAQVFWVLAAYFICVVPVNFLVLKKLKRGELAWFTAPVISLAFAGILFKSAGALYSAKMSTVSGGIVIGQEGLQEGMFIGNTQMFIPHAGLYDLKLQGVDTLSSGGQDNDYYGGMGRSYDNQDRDLDPIDVGEVEIPRMPANNLAFRKINYRQLVPISKWFHIRLVPISGQKARCQISNISPYALTGAAISVDYQTMTIGDLAPGKQITRDVTLSANGQSGDLGSTDVRMFTIKKDRAALTGVIEGYRPGPQIGADVPGRSKVNLALFSDWQERAP